MDFRLIFLGFWMYYLDAKNAIQKTALEVGLYPLVGHVKQLEGWGNSRDAKRPTATEF